MTWVLVILTVWAFLSLLCVIGFLTWLARELLKENRTTSPDPGYQAVVEVARAGQETVRQTISMLCTSGSEPSAERSSSEALSAAMRLAETPVWEMTRHPGEMRETEEETQEKGPLAAGWATVKDLGNEVVASMPGPVDDDPWMPEG